jgi:hypothetical protein
MADKPKLLTPLRINPLDLLPEEELTVDNFDPAAPIPDWMSAAVKRADAKLASGQNLRP